MQWSDKFNTGLESVDAQHQRLFQLITDLETALAEGKGVGGVAEQLDHYVIEHFSEERQLMRKYQVDLRHCTVHFNAHKNFKGHLQEIFDELQAGEAESMEIMLDYLKHWLRYHILGTDHKMSRQIELIKSGLSPERAYYLVEGPETKDDAS